MDEELRRKVAEKQSGKERIEREAADLEYRTIQAFARLGEELQSIVSNSPAQGYLRAHSIKPGIGGVHDRSRSDEYAQHIYGPTLDAHGLGRVSHNPVTGTWGLGYHPESSVSELVTRDQVLEQFRSRLASYIVYQLPTDQRKNKANREPSGGCALFLVLGLVPIFLVDSFNI